MSDTDLQHSVSSSFVGDNNKIFLLTRLLYVMKQEHQNQGQEYVSILISLVLAHSKTPQDIVSWSPASHYVFNFLPVKCLS